jgi:hypothetical protein
LLEFQACHASEKSAFSVCPTRALTVADSLKLRASSRIEAGCVSEQAVTAVGSRSQKLRRIAPLPGAEIRRVCQAALPGADSS